MCILFPFFLNSKHCLNVWRTTLNFHLRASKIIFTFLIVKLGKEVEKGVGLPKLQVCSPELEELIDKGRIPDRTARPTIEEIVQKLDEHVKSIRKM